MVSAPSPELTPLSTYVQDVQGHWAGDGNYFSVKKKLKKLRNTSEEGLGGS